LIHENGGTVLYPQSNGCMQSLPFFMFGIKMTAARDKYT